MPTVNSTVDQYNQLAEAVAQLNTAIADIRDDLVQSVAVETVNGVTFLTHNGKKFFVKKNCCNSFSLFSTDLGENSWVANYKGTIDDIRFKIAIGSISAK